MSAPTVSVVMSVYNGARYLREAVDSILGQTLRDFELIVVNDGSTDVSGEILAEYQDRDSRVRVLTQENQGLTRALIRGCAAARGHYLARQDADDVSLPARLEKQVSYLALHSEVTLVSSWTRFIGPEGEELSVLEGPGTNEEATSRLRCADVRRFHGVNGHGSTMFRHDDYLRAGGYRWQFWAAQDLDLWLRLTDLGLLAFLPEVLYLARFTLDCISMRSHADQVELAGIIIESAKARQSGRSDEPWLSAAAAMPRSRCSSSNRDTAKGAHFIGSCLVKRGDRRGVKYLKQAIRKDPFHWRAWAVLLRHGLFNR